jgi:hypothetical protein
MSNTIKLYHGTNSQDTNNVLDYPTTSRAINGNAFYVTEDIDVAGMYGKHVVCWEINQATRNMIASATKPINQMYTENMELYAKCAEQGMEIALTQREADLMATLCMDAYLITD